MKYNLCIHIIGVIAGILTTSAFVPQVVKILKTRKVRDISLPMYVVLTIGIFLWLVYGILLRMLPIILPNAIALFLCSMVIAIAIRYKEND